MAEHRSISKNNKNMFYTQNREVLCKTSVLVFSQGNTEKKVACGLAKAKLVDSRARHRGNNFCGS